MVGPAQQSLLYGKGVFTTVAIVNGAPFLWDKHWRRLTTNAEKLEIDISQFNAAKLLWALERGIEIENLREGRARITFTDKSESEIWSAYPQKLTRLSIITAERRSVSSEFSLTVSPHRINTTSPLAGIKSCNYLEHLLAHKEARSRGFDEAVRLNERSEIASGCMANIFWLKGGKLYTPSLTTGCLPGTTREFILENLDCEEVEAGIEEMDQAETIFLTSAGLGVLQVRDFDGRKFETVDHEIQTLI